MAAVPTIMDQYHRLRRDGDTAGAENILALALQVPSYRAEAQLWRGITALHNGDYPEAFLWLAQAAEAMPQRPDVAALLGRAAMGQNQPELARKLLEAAWRRHPTDPALRVVLWQARAACQTAEETVVQMRRALQYMESGEELRHVLRYLAQNGAGTVGAAHYRPKDGAIEGWAVDLRNPSEPAALQLHIGNKMVELTAKQPHQPLADAGYPGRHGGFRIKLQPQTVPVRVTDDDGVDLDGSPMAITAILPGVPGYPFKKPATNDGQNSPEASASLKRGATKGSKKKKGKTGAIPPIVDVLIPVYEGLEETLACVNSVLRYHKANHTPHQIIVLNDASPNAELTEALQTLAHQGTISHVLRSVNLGFIRNINRGMALHPDRDVVWLNSDTRVHGNWLDRLRAAAYADQATASATPFSNNGELVSFPHMREAAPMPSSTELAQLDNLAAGLGNSPVEIETGCGFCFYIKRVALDNVGLLDEAILKRGYGEETDWCLRARDLGWKHVAATNVWVGHQGGVSFKDEKRPLVKHNNDILRQRYPTASCRFEQFLRVDPLAPARDALQRARLKQTEAALSEAADHSLMPRLLSNRFNLDTSTNSMTTWLTADALVRIPDLPGLTHHETLYLSGLTTDGNLNNSSRTGWLNMCASIHSPYGSVRPLVRALPIQKTAF